MKRRFVGVLLALSALGCAAEMPMDEEIEVKIGGEGKADTYKTFELYARKRVTARFTPDGTAVRVAVDCGVSDNPDETGAVFSITAPALGIPRSTSLPRRDGSWSWTGVVPQSTTQARITITGKSGEGECKLTIDSAPNACEGGLTTTFHSPNTHHTHYAVGSETSNDWEPFPASGNHWGAWAKWNTAYGEPVKRPFILHNLEHGGIVLSYKCDSQSESSECTDAAQKLVDLANQFGQGRILITPDPTQPSMFAIRAWRWGYSSDCLDDGALQFIEDHYRHGREDLDEDPPIPFDPTTTDVPCQDLMAAPDSC